MYFSKYFKLCTWKKWNVNSNPIGLIKSAVNISAVNMVCQNVGYTGKKKKITANFQGTNVF